MWEIEDIKMALMEKIPGTEKPEGNDYISKTATLIKFMDYIKETHKELWDQSEEIKQDIVSQISDYMFKDLLERNGDQSIDSVGIWLTMGDKILENSLDLSTIEGMIQYGEEGINPIFELIKMTIDLDGQRIV